MNNIVEIAITFLKGKIFIDIFQNFVYYYKLR